MSFDRLPLPGRMGPVALAAAMLLTCTMPQLTQAQVQAQAQEAVDAADVAAAAPLQLSRSLSTRTLGAMSYATRVKNALVQVSQEHPEVQAAQAAADTRGFEVEAAQRARYPRFNVGTASGTYNSGQEGSSSQSYQLITASARMSLIDGGAISARTRAAERSNEAQVEAVKTTSQKVVLDALTAYMQLQRFDLKKQIARKSTQVLDDLAKAEQRRVALGAAGQNDLQMATSRRAGIAAKESDFDAQRGEALAKFQTYFKFIPVIDRLPVLSVPIGWKPRSQSDALAQAEDRSTEIGEARGRVERAKALLDQAEASVYPTLDAVVVKTKDPRGVSPSEPTRAAFELNWAFGNGFEQSLRIKSAAAEVTNQEAALDGVRLNLSELTSASWSRSVSGLEREKQLLSAVSESGQAFRGRRRLLEFGRETLPIVLDAQVEYYTLLLDYVDAVFDLRISEFRLARTTGRLLVARDDANTWIDSVITAAQRPPLTEDSLLETPCLVGASTCRDDAPAAGLQPVAPGNGLTLRRASALSRN
ncbi:TolC family outer membrane protein [soil metagenome]